MKQIFLKNTRTDFLDYWKNVNDDVEAHFEKKIAELQLLQQTADMTGSLFFVVNIPEQRFETFSGRILSGHNPVDYMQSGFDYTFEQFHPDFLRMAFESYNHIFNAWYDSPAHIREQIVVYRDMLYHNGNRKNPGYVRVLEKIKPFALDKNNKVSLIFGTVNDITYLKKNENGTMAVKIPSQEVYFYHYDTLCNTITAYGNFTSQQSTILKLLSKGLSSQDIARLLAISPHTVDSHRRNMLQMTNCINTTALIIYCRMCGML